MPAPALLFQLARHIGCYLQLGASVAEEYRSAWVRRAVLTLVAVIAFLAGSMALWATGLVALWDTPWRLTYLVVSATVLLTITIVAAYSAAVTRKTGPAAAQFGAELRKDMELFQEWKRTL
jgi:hypothetical protein